MSSDTIVTVKQGQLKGARRGNLTVFRAIPYARAKRFEPPQPAPAWEGVRLATEPGPICPQSPARLEFLMGSPTARQRQSEVCQVLSVFTPSLSGKRPVMVWIHGGAYISGGGEEAWYDASRLAEEGDVVTVTITYRLGALGYLHADQSHATNVGLRDQLMALRWIRDNISQFGGDPDCVTVFGQSAGAHSIAAILATEPSPPFRRAIMQSLPGPVVTRKAAEAVRADLRGLLQASVDTAPAGDILDAQRKIVARAKGGMSFGPAGIDTLEPRAPAERPLDILFTWTRDDGVPFVAMRRENQRFGGPLDRMLGALVTRKFFAKPARALAARLRAAGHRVATYEVTWRPRGSPYGAAHCVELPLLLGGAKDWARAPMLGSEPRETVERYGKEARARWTSFARTGEPPSRTDWLQPQP